MQSEKIMPPAKFSVLFLTHTHSVKLVDGTGDDYYLNTSVVEHKFLFILFIFISLMDRRQGVAL